MSATFAGAGVFPFRTDLLVLFDQHTHLAEEAKAVRTGGNTMDAE
jgi:hypothetical protein